jgi:hypothetical protein
MLEGKSMEKGSVDLSFACHTLGFKRILLSNQLSKG